ncbi:hypothetical protein PVA44_02540 [Entomospira nematocerorum]|uniref:Uncharacterized protein n=1 Tax=Entomospira nematocerorum TaxID=2719987 RepID=A0A968KVA8_9SPIO|nr:hypothetical protein [Entomospira nematocera]NIZ47088.1 hypothetical protein [Entomospira nematocera]WDI34367.1 hypothetical protein PVA44_02540 [Entomospira nematocera]
MAVGIRHILRYFSLSIVLAHSLFAYEWPSADAQILWNFGQRSDTNGIRKGMRLQTQQNSIYTIDSGEVLFIQDENSLLPSRFASNIFVNHEDGLASAYTNIDTTDILDLQQIPLKLQSNGLRQYDLYLYDIHQNQHVNPVLFLPLGRSGSRVMIEKMIVTDINGNDYLIYNGAVLPSGEVDFYVSVSSITSSGRRLAPMEVQLQMLGNTLAGVRFSAIAEEGGNAYLAEGTRPIWLKNLYNNQGLLHLVHTKLHVGQLNLVLKVANIDGEMQESTMRVRVVNLN